MTENTTDYSTDDLSLEDEQPMDLVVGENADSKDDHEDEDEAEVCESSKLLGDSKLPCDGLLQAISDEGYNLSWQDLNYKVKVSGWFTKKPPFIRACWKKKQKTILSNLSGFAAAGRMLAIMGPSGCGKTTFLDILAHRVKSGSIKGDIHLNGRPCPKKMKRLTAYVMQDDALIGDLTVRTNLMFSALLRLPLSVSYKEKKQRVDHIIEKLGLQDCANTIIGSPFRRGVSGGQRRRVSIGMELITDPPILFLDEPTSGLDSKSAASVVDILIKLAHEENRTIICTIHSPTSQIYSMFDDVMLLSRGELIYCGPREGAVVYFKKQDLPVGQHVNPADHFLDVINYQFDKEEEEEVEVEEEDEESAGSKRQKKDEVKRTGVPPHVRKLVDNFPSCKAADCNRKRIERVHEDEFLEKTEHLCKHVKGKYATPFWWQTIILMLRTFIVFVKNPSVYWARVLMYFLLALMMGTLFFQISDDQKSIQDRVSVLFFSVAFLTFMSIAALPAFIEDRILFVRERMNNAYRVGSYTLSQTFVSIPFILLIAVVFSVTAYFLIGLQYDGFGIFLADLFLALIVAESMVVAISAIVPNFIVGIAMGAGMFGMFMLACGFFVRKTNIPGWWIWAHYISFHKYAFEVFMYNEFKGQSFPCEPMTNTTYFCSYPNLSSHPETLDGEQILATLEYDDVKMWAWLLVLLGMALFFRIVFYLLLRFANKGKR